MSMLHCIVINVICHVITKQRLLFMSPSILLFQVDPLYQKTASSFDEGGIEGLLLNNLFVLSDSCELVVDPCTSLKALHTLPPPCLYPRKELEGLYIYHYFVLVYAYVYICFVFGLFFIWIHQL